jgi:hypothetical protein
MVTFMVPFMVAALLSLGVLSPSKEQMDSWRRQVECSVGDELPCPEPLKLCDMWEGGLDVLEVLDAFDAFDVCDMLDVLDV